MRQAFAYLVRSLIVSPSTSGQLLSRLIYALVVFIAALPFAGWPAPSAWLLVMSILMLSDRQWRAGHDRALSERAGETERFSPFDWLLSTGYSIAALYFVLFYTGAAQTFGVTLYGVVMFQILARTYASPRRLLANLIPPVLSMVAVQCAAIALRIEQGEPLQIITLLASPYIVFRAFRAVQGNLTESLARERDMAARAKATALQIAEAHHNAIMAEELAGVGHWRLNVATGASYWSDSVFQIFGLKRASGPPSFDDVALMFSAEDRSEIYEHLAGALREGKAFEFETHFNRADGSVRHVAINGAVERDEDAEVAIVFGAFMDVTDARVREEALRESEARFRLLADHGTDLVIWLAVDGTILYVSPSAKKLGYSPEQVIGRKTFEFVHPDDRERAIDVIRGLFTGAPVDESIRREYRVRTADGRYVWLEGNPTIIRDHQGRVTSAVTSYRDVTARRRLEDDLLDAKLHAEAAAEAKAEFLANMSHEIRTPLTGILGFSGLLGQVETLPVQARTYVERIETSGRSLLAVVNDILDFSKLEAGQVRLDPHPFDLSDLLKQTVATFSAPAAAKAIELSLKIEPGTPDRLSADSSRLQQVLNNLIGNAIKFTEEGSVRIAAGYDGERLRIAVTDSGVGVPQDKLDLLFQRFSQVDGSVSRRYGGTGLGLSICKSLVELMGGEIDVVSTVGVGSTFAFSVPAQAADHHPAVEDRRQDRVASSRRANVLVVDDLEVNRELIRAILEAADHQVAEAASGADAVDIAARTPFDLILMDLQMPGMDGFAAARAIRRHAAPNRATPIVALSANVLAEHVQASLAAGMNDHIGKPIVVAVLLEAVGRWAGARVDEAGKADAL